jgi:succinyl-diaminopimelate desuccinylase
MQTYVKRIMGRVDSLEDYLISLAKDLISIPTVNPPGLNYEECVRFLAGKLKEIGLNVEYVRVPNEKLPELAPQGSGLPRVNLIASHTFDESGPTLHFNGHYDVVPATGSWSTDPFEPVVKDGKLYGRGSSDMKGGIASMMVAIKALIDLDLNLNGELSISAVCDEETGGFAGSGFIVNEKLVEADYCVVGEPSGVRNILNAHKGALWVEITTFGKSAHASTPWLGVNAFEKMVKIVNEIDRELGPRVESKISKFPTVLLGGNRASIMVGGVVNCGRAANMVPDRCTLTVDRRFIPEEKVEDVKDEFSSLLQKLQREDPELRYQLKFGEINACSTPKDSHLCRTLNESVKKVTASKPSITMCPGTLDMRYFAGAGIQTVAYGPGLMELSHIENEYVLIDDLIAAAKIYALTALKLLSQKNA